MCFIALNEEKKERGDASKHLFLPSLSLSVCVGSTVFGKVEANRLIFLRRGAEDHRETGEGESLRTLVGARTGCGVILFFFL